MRHCLKCISLTLAVLLTVGGGCVRRGKGTPEPGAPVLLGEFSALTGRQAPFGTATHRGIVLAVEEANAAGGLEGRPVRLITHDDRGDVREAIRAVERLATEDEVHVVLGEIASSLSLAAAPVAQRLKIPMISPGSTHPDVTKAGSYVFRVCFTDPFQGAVMARFALNELKFRRAAVLMDEQSEYSRGLAEHFAREYAAFGGLVVARGSYREGQTEFRKTLQPLVAAKPDLIFLPGYFSEVGPAAREARRMGFKGVFLGGDGWESDELREAGGKAIVGAYFSNHFSAEDRNPEVQSFVARYRHKYGESPAALAAVGYDAARVALDAIRRAGGLDRNAIRKALAETRNFPGVSGIITINSRRDAVKPAVVLKVSAKGPHHYVTTLNP